MVDFYAKNYGLVDQLQNWGAKLDKKLTSIAGKVDKKLIEFSRGAKDIASSAFHPVSSIKKQIKREKNALEADIYREVRKEFEGKPIIVKADKSEAFVFENKRMKDNDILIYAKNDNSLVIKQKLPGQKELFEIKTTRENLAYVLKQLLNSK